MSKRLTTNDDLISTALVLGALVLAILFLLGTSAARIVIALGAAS